MSGNYQTGTQSVPLTTQAAAEQDTSLSRSSGLFGSVAKKVTVLSLVLFAITLFVYQPVKSLYFTNYDDPAYVTMNPHVLSGLTWHNAVWAFTSLEVSYWHPLTWLSHMLDCTLFGVNPAGHHFMNLLLHAINVVLVFFLLIRCMGG